jgi:ribosomal protein L37AE/L43A
MKTEISGICPNCGRKAKFRLIGSDIFRCMKCQKTIYRENIKETVRYEDKTRSLFGDADTEGL